MPKSIKPMSVVDFLKRFPDEDSGRQFFEEQRWGVFLIDEQKWVIVPRCPDCGSDRTHPWKKHKRKGYHKCNICRRLFCVKSKSVFEGTRSPMHHWLLAWYFLIIHRKGVPSTTLRLYLDISQPAAWRLMTRARKMMGRHKTGIILKRKVEVDEGFFAGTEEVKHACKKLHGDWMTGKQVVLGLRERGGYVITTPVPDNNTATLLNEIKRLVARGSTIYTDGHPSYRGLPALGYPHDWVYHNRGQYVKGDATTNGIESVWAVQKRSQYGIYHKIMPEYRALYQDEYDFRLNIGNLKNSTMKALEMLAADCWYPCQQTFVGIPVKEKDFKRWGIT